MLEYPTWSFIHFQPPSLYTMNTPWQSIIWYAWIFSALFEIRRIFKPTHTNFKKKKKGWRIRKFTINNWTYQRYLSKKIPPPRFSFSIESHSRLLFVLLCFWYLVKLNTRYLWNKGTAVAEIWFCFRSLNVFVPSAKYLFSKKRLRKIYS